MFQVRIEMFEMLVTWIYFGNNKTKLKKDHFNSELVFNMMYEKHYEKTP